MPDTEVTVENLDRETILNMERCATFVASMIEKYGKEVLEEIEKSNNEN